MGRWNTSCRRTGPPAPRMALQAGLTKINLVWNCWVSWQVWQENILPPAKVYFYRMLFHIASRHTRQIKLTQADVEINVILSHAMENTPTRATHDRRTASLVVLSLLTILGSTNIKHLLCLTDIHIPRAETTIQQKDNIKNSRGWFSQLFCFPPEKRHFKYWGRIDIRHDKKRLSAMYSSFKMLSLVRQLNCKDEILVHIASLIVW